MATIPSVEVPVSVRASVNHRVTRTVRVWATKDKHPHVDEQCESLYVGSPPTATVTEDNKVEWSRGQFGECLAPVIDLKLLGIHLEQGQCREVTIEVRPMESGPSPIAAAVKSLTAAEAFRKELAARVNILDWSFFDLTLGNPEKQQKADAIFDELAAKYGVTLPQQRQEPARR